uniref:Uncharacterized protein n=1 Tax=Rhizophora mucronata TaxID=61149 RepID=A0A2P2QQ47_RHIMU
MQLLLILCIEDDIVCTRPRELEMIFAVLRHDFLRNLMCTELKDLCIQKAFEACVVGLVVGIGWFCRLYGW